LLNTGSQDESASHPVVLKTLAPDAYHSATLLGLPMAILAKLDGAFTSEQRVVAFGSAAARLMRAFATQVEVLRRLRSGGQQFVRVEHVHVNDGGQAVIGNVQQQDTQVEERRTM
jgi:hypothetical protein